MIKSAHKNNFVLTTQATLIKNPPPLFFSRHDQAGWNNNQNYVKNTHPFSHCISSFEGISYKIYKIRGTSSFISCFIIFVISLYYLF